MGAYVFRGQSRLGWKPLVVVVAVAAATAAAVVYLTAGGHGEPSSAAERTGTSDGTPTSGGTPTTSSGALGLADIVPAKLWAGCRSQTPTDPDAIESATCLPQSDIQGFQPDLWQVSTYPNGRTAKAAYESARRGHDIPRNQGKCNQFSLGRGGAWEHGPGKPGGRVLCYFDGDDAVIVWIPERLGQPSHKDVLAVAREGGSDHARLFLWWRPWHHLIGKAE